MTPCLRALSVSVFLAGAVWLAACSTGESDLPLTPEDNGGGGPPTNATPVVVVPGEYVSPAGYPEARERGMQAKQAEAGEPTFEGVISGIALRRMAPENFPDYCGDADFDRFDSVEILKFGYLPPGTAVVTPQNAAVCPDGTQAVVGEEFQGSNFMFEAYFRRGDGVALHDAPESRVSQITINGLAGVAVAPLTEDGYGSSQIAWVTPSGMLQVTAFDLPFAEVKKIAEGIECAGC